MPRSRTALVAVVAIAGLAAGACGRRAASPAHPKQVVIWRPIGSWSGSGNRQTESFASDTGALRVRWETHPQGAGGPFFRLTAHSAISGRPLQQVAEQRQAGHGTGYVNQDPHTFYMEVEATGLSWSFSVEEGIAGEVVGGPGQ